MTAIPITVIVTTKNEAKRIENCIAAIKDFEQIIIVDSASTDNTVDLARARGAEIVNFKWNNQYPKKRQWCLNNLIDQIRHDWVFFVDADESVTPELIAELKSMDWTQTDHAAGYFVRGQYILDGRPLHYGLMNNKLALINAKAMEFPVVDDLDIEGMGEIEGHYQPVLKNGYEHFTIDQIKAPLLHDACDDQAAWEARHKRYANWERGMDARNAWPEENTPRRAAIKTAFRSLPPSGRALIAFAHSYILKRGFLDGRRGLKFAKMRASYYRNQFDI